ncbi:hypothetical protein T439DRAFT_1951 [Meredithblackwellia eburnea MCA 4105]
MLPNFFIIRFFLRLIIALLDLIAPLSLLYTTASFFTSPAPPFVAFLSQELVHEAFKYDYVLQIAGKYFAGEAIWLIVHSFGRFLVANGFWDLQQTNEEDTLETEERWRIWIKMLESCEDPWDWMGGAFLEKGWKRAKEGMRDKAVQLVKREQVGRANVEEYIAHFFFGVKLSALKKKSVERAEIHSMISLLELVMSNSKWKEGKAAFRFARGRSKHKVFLIYEEPIVTAHHPMLFYIIVWLCSGVGNTTLWLAGFRYYGSRRSWPFPLFFMRGSGKALDRLLSSNFIKTSDIALADRVGYWFHPGSAKAQNEGLTPVIFFHGISGTYGPAPFIIFLRLLTGRPFFLPEFPYVTMRLSPPSAIITRRETVAAARRMLYRHGFGLTNILESDEESVSGHEDGDDDEWRRGKAILVGHSLGAGPVAWLLRDAPDIIAGTVLVDAMSVLLFAADGPRNFFRTRVRTAGEIFFKYFASERGINHFLSRHLRWTDSAIFATGTPHPLPDGSGLLIPECAVDPLEPPDDIPNFAPALSPSPLGPFPSILFYSESDCILPIPKIQRYLTESGFEVGKSLEILPKIEHAGILIRSSWARKVAKAIDEVDKAADAVEKKRWELIAQED